RQEQREPFVDRDLRGVRLDLAEVRVDRRIERVIAEPRVQVYPELRVRVSALEADVRPRARRRDRDYRLRLENDAATKVAQPRQRAALAEKARTGASHGGPRVDKARALRLSLDVQAPRELRVRRVPQAAE